MIYNGFFSLWTNTMNRCNALNLPTLLAPLLIATLGLFQTVAYAQTDTQADPAAKRRFPTASLRGELIVTAPPDILLDGRPDRLSPGARIRNTDNQMVLTGSLTNQPVVVNYVRDPMGQVSEVWVLTADEARENRRGLFDIITNYNTNSTPAHPDDGKTPYDQLPAYGK